MTVSNVQNNHLLYDPRHPGARPPGVVPFPHIPDGLLEKLHNHAQVKSDQPPPPDPRAENNARVEALLDGRKDTGHTDDDKPPPYYFSTGPAYIPPYVPPSKDQRTSAAKLTDGMPDADQRTKELNRPVAAAEYLADNWDKWHLGKNENFDELVKNPPKDLPPEARDMLQYVNDHPAMKNAMDVANAHGKKADGLFSKKDMQAFAHNVKDQQDEAATAFQDWKKANPNAGDVATEMARSASILIANQALLHAADPDVPGDKHPLVSQRALDEVAKEGFGAVSDAARLFAQPGMFDQVDRAGISIATNDPDHLYNVPNLTAWLKDGAPKNDKEALAMYQKAATQNAIASLHGDTSAIHGDLFKVDADGNVTVDKDKYTPAQRAAALVELQEARAKLGVGAQQNLYNGDQAKKYGLNPNPDKVAGDLDKRIAALSQDEDVNKAVSGAIDGAYKALGDADPAVKAKLESYYDNYVTNGAGLRDAADGKQLGDDGKPLSTGDGVAQFIGQANTLAKMLGKDDPDLATILDKPELADTKNKLQKTYLDDIVSGNRIDQIIKDNPGMDVEQAIAKAGRESIALTSVMNKDLVAQHKDEQNQNFTQHANDALIGNTDITKVIEQFTRPDGSLDEAKLQQALDKMQQANPDLFASKDGKSMASDIIKAVKGAWDAARGSAKLSDALTKTALKNILGDIQNNNKLDPAYKKGLLHGVSSVFGAFALTARAIDKQNPNAKDIVSYMGSALTVIGTGIEGVTKNLTTKTDDAAAKAKLKNIESAGKVVGGAGNIITGVIGIVDGAKQLKSDQAGGAVNITSGTLFTTAGALSIVEGGAALAGWSTVSELAGAASGALGIVGAVFAVGIAIWQIVEMALKEKKQKQDTHTFFTQIDPVLDRYGVTGGPIQKGDEPEPPPEPDPYANWQFYPV